METYAVSTTTSTPQKLSEKPKKPKLYPKLPISAKAQYRVSERIFGSALAGCRSRSALQAPPLTPLVTAWSLILARAFSLSLALDYPCVRSFSLSRSTMHVRAASIDAVSTVARLRTRFDMSRS